MAIMSIQGSQEPIHLDYEAFPQGSKNACLPLIAASLLFPEITLTNVPRILDVQIMGRMLKRLNVSFSLEGNSYRKFPSLPHPKDPGLDFFETRAGFFLAAALIFRFETWAISDYRIAGDPIGDRGYEKIFGIFRSFGVDVVVDGCSTRFAVARRYLGAQIDVQDRGICATAVALILASQFQAETTLVGPTRAPEIHDLVRLLELNGVGISRYDRTWKVAKTSKSPICGNFHVQADRIVIGTYANLALVSGGSFRIPSALLKSLGTYIRYLIAVGCFLKRKGPGEVVLTVPNGMESLDLTIDDFPAVSTDLQPMMTVLMCCSRGQKRISDRIFPDRWAHVSQLEMMGQSLTRFSGGLIINGSQPFRAANLKGHDIRCTAALIIASSIARGTSHLWDWECLNRGYESLTELVGQYRKVSMVYPGFDGMIS